MTDVKTTSDLIQMNNIDIKAKAGDFSSYPFWYYTSLSTADKILFNKNIHISNLANMNDRDECILHEKEKEFVHCLCFCNSNTEKIPMWYLYAGVAGRGASIKFTPRVMLDLISSIDTLTSTDGTKTLYKGTDFDIIPGWVYYKKVDEKSQVFYRNKWYTLSDPYGFEEGNYFVKSYPWEYEREFRIVIINKTDQAYDRLIVDISKVYSKLKVKLAPELRENDFDELFSDLKGFQKFSIESYLRSDLQIKMDLFKRNLDSFVDYINSDCEDLLLKEESRKKLEELKKVLDNYIESADKKDI